jgi:hypothetical protein
MDQANTILLLASCILHLELPQTAKYCLDQLHECLPVGTRPPLYHPMDRHSPKLDDQAEIGAQVEVQLI